ncbi:MAG: polysaccharide deacetylase family protein [Bacteroides sp.]|nr:polysaccharide deacetylase family protein [Eubacterium sp.]MCM1418624.1 polysaccharide deacetylase family protein [Roseburia sp.]MCM1462678.1 polysaccharide deacetylase family protein [Bacteroides sp.]
MSGRHRLAALLLSFFFVTASSCAAGEEQTSETAAATTTTAPAETTTTAETAPAQTAEATEAPAEDTETDDSTPSQNENESETAAEENEEDEMTQDSEKKVIALTFDDGPNTTTTNEVLDVLEKYGIKASFFLIGNNIDEESAKSVKRAYDMGCEIGNHSRSHSYMDKMTVEEIAEEVESVNEKIIEITGEAPTFFRPPYIAVNDKMFETIEMPFIAGYGANDWEDRIPAEKRAEMVLRQAKDGAIILLHDAKGNTKTVEALDTIIPALQAEGYEFVTISEVFRARGAEPKAHDRRIYSFAEQTLMYG